MESTMDDMPPPAAPKTTSHNTPTPASGETPPTTASKGEAPQGTPQPSVPQPAIAPGHVSNPFPTALQGAKKLFSLNAGPFAGMLGLMLAFGLVVALLAFVAGAGFLASLLQASPQLSTQLDTAASATLSGAAVVGVLVGLIVVLFAASFFTVMQNKLLAASSLGRKISFGELFKVSLRRTLPMLGQLGLILAALAAVGLLLVLFLNVPVLLFLAILAAVAGGFYLAVRLAYAGFALAEENLGPVQAFKRSWHLTKARFGETMGAIFAAALIFGVPFALLEALMSLTGNMGLSLLGSVLNAIAGVVLMAGVAERYAQHRHLTDSNLPKPKTHLLNYFSPLILFGGLMIVGLVVPPQAAPPAPGSLEEYLNSSQSTDSTDPGASLEEYLREQGIDTTEDPYDPSMDEVPVDDPRYNLN